MPSYTSTGKLHPTAPFDLAQALRFLGDFLPTKNQYAIGDLSLTKAFSIGHQTVVIKVQSVGSVEKPELAYTLNAEKDLSKAEQETAVDSISFYLSLNDDLRPLYALADSDPMFASVVKQLYGYHHVKFSVPAFESACWALLSQRNVMSLSWKQKQSLIDQFGGRITVHGVAYRAFPRPETLAAIDVYDLTQLLGNARKAEGILSVARGFKSVDEHFLRTGPSDEVEAWLKRIKGIGDWSATFVMLRALGRMERIYPAEKRLLNAFYKRYGPQQAIEDVARKYGELQGYWAHYLRAAG